MVNRGIYDHGWTACSKSILPWQATNEAITSTVDPFTAPWELCNIDKDFSQAVDLAQQEPEKLQQMKDLFWAMAAKYDVLPLQWNTAGRLSGVRPFARPSLTRGRTLLTYYPGMIRMQDNVAPNTYNRSFRITTEADIPESGANGALIALGGVEGGWSFTDEDGKLVFHYNWVMASQYRVTSDTPLPTGKAQLVADVAYDGGMGKGATVTLSANGVQIGEGRVDKTVPLLYGTDGFDIDGDYGSPVSPAYSSPFAFTGTLEKVTIDLL
ncbi:MAG TPA: hypothetical protein VFI12_11425 [Thermomicrobiales bacterium]|jgi:arylsulfatase|nr:hypothetical protein [Thermomicrobiales bacterium]